MSAAALRRLRRGLLPASWLYRGAIGVRNAAFDRGLRSITALPVPVVSVGNLAAGGTGKTPLVAWLVEAALAAGHRPGVLARGYGRAGDAVLNDEGAMLAARFPDLLQVQQPDRVVGGRRLIELGADVIMLDDAFQHRRLARRRDLVCLDGERPFDDGLLPAGNLREPPSALRRADGVVLTRVGRLDEAARASRIAAVRAAARRHDLPVWCTEHRVRDLHHEPQNETVPAATLRGRRVGLLCAIARPDAFARTVADELSAEIVWQVRCRDHHRFTPDELDAIAARAARDDVTVVTTEKDAPKLVGWSQPRVVVRIDLHFERESPSPEWLWGEP